MTPEELAAAIKADTAGRYVLRQTWHCTQCQSRRAIAWAYAELDAGEVVAQHLLLGGRRGPRQDGDGATRYPPAAFRLELRPGAWLADCPRCRAAHLFTATVDDQRLWVGLRTDVELDTPTWAVVAED